MDILEKLTILSDAAKYDVACTSSGVDRAGAPGSIGNSAACGICHSFSADGRCISLLKVLLSNVCAFDCSYCVNRKSNDIRRATFEPHELAELMIQFYRRNYIEGLFLSSAVMRNPDYTCEQMIEVLSLIRNEYRFRGYIHVKAIPGTDERLLTALGLLADRMSINLELPSGESLKLLAPDKSRESILNPMAMIKAGIQENRTDLVKYKKTPQFVPAGQSTQMIVGATPETDYQIINLSAALYKKYELKRVFYSAYMPVLTDKNLPAIDSKPQLLREHRLYQADWLLRFYKFDVAELLDEKNPNFNLLIDPKCNWALNHYDYFPVEINTAPYETLLRVPGLGVIGAKKILKARRVGTLDFPDLKKMNIVLKRAQYFITCRGKTVLGIKNDPESVLRGLLSDQSWQLAGPPMEQLSLFDDTNIKSIETLEALRSDSTLMKDIPLLTG
ncbi:MAG: putative DNA modification/repair radical SAM protein [Oscillospiraceae bacterium]|jgi:putative DNA modification/repair radical SAM protein|nr:putative DNA modification/repair radical SAM protein [Oscillospiraceae bacterium]